MFSLFKLGSEKMKVFKTIFLCVVLIFALAGCGNSHAEADKTVKQGSGQKTDGAVNASEESTKGAAESAKEVCCSPVLLKCRLRHRTMR